MSAPASAAKSLSRHDLTEIVARSTFLQERFTKPISTLETPDGGSRLNEWKQAAALGNEALFQKRLAFSGLAPEDIGGILGRVKLPDDCGLPTWTETLSDFVNLGTMCGSIGDFADRFCFLKGDEPVAFEELFCPLVEIASREVLTRCPAERRLLEDAAFWSLQRALLKFVSGLAAETLDLEFSVFRERKQMDGYLVAGWPGLGSREVYEAFVTSLLSGGLRDVFIEYPVLARFVADGADLWVESTCEFLCRLEADSSAIARRFCEGANPGQIAEVKPGLSDRHNGARTTVYVRFENGLRLFYKPKDLRSEHLFSALLEWLNEQGSSLPFLVPRVLNRDSHGWSEEVPHLPCRTEAEIDRYFERAGMLLAVLFALEASDCHSENIIASGEHPVLVDTETLLQQRVRLDDSTPAGDGANSLTSRMLFWDSSFRTGMLPRWEFGVAGESYDSSGLGGVDSHKTSFRTNNWENVNSDAMRLRRQTVSTRLRQNTVRFNGEVIMPDRYVDRIVSGFREMYRLLSRRAEALFAPGAPLSEMAGMPIRFIYRATKIYAVVLKDLLSPQCLRDGADAGICLEVLARPLLNSEMPQCFWSILEDEQRVLARGDIPVFYSVANSDALETTSGACLPRFFESSGFDQLLQRFHNLSDLDCERQAAYIRSAFHSRTFSSQSQPGSAVVEVETAALAERDLKCAFLAEALKIAREIREVAVTSSDGSVSWITMAYFQDAQRWQLQPMGPCMYDGLGGTALFLSAADQFADGEFRDLATGALRTMRSGFAVPMFERFLSALGVGAGIGATSVLYSLVRCRELSGDESLLKDARKIADMLTPDRIRKDARLDLIGGAAGAIVALLAFYKLTREQDLLDRAEACGRHLLDKRVPGDKGFRAWPTVRGQLLTGFSHGAAGVAYALAKLYQATHVDAFRDAALEGCAYERSLYDADAANWPDLRYPPADGRPAFQCSWCHGAPGIALGRLSMIAILDIPELRQDLDQALHTTFRHSALHLDHLCCGTMGIAGVLFSAGNTLGISKYVDKAKGLASFVLRRARQTGQYSLGWGRGPYLPSFQQGMSGIGYQFLRMAEPELLPDALRWE